MLTVKNGSKLGKASVCVPYYSLTRIHGENEGEYLYDYNDM